MGTYAHRMIELRVRRVIFSGPASPDGPLPAQCRAFLLEIMYRAADSVRDVGLRAVIAVSRRYTQEPYILSLN